MREFVSLVNLFFQEGTADNVDLFAVYLVINFKRMFLGLDYTSILLLLSGGKFSLDFYRQQNNTCTVCIK